MHYPIVLQDRLRTPGIEPGLKPWKGVVLPLYYVRAALGGSRTHNLELTVNGPEGPGHKTRALTN